MHHSDCVISVGARFDDRVTGDIKRFAPEARKAEREGRGGLIHFDIAPEQINKAVAVTIGVEGDARKNLELLLPMLEGRGPERREWLEQIEKWRSEHPFRYRHDDREFHMKPQAVMEELDRQTGGEAIVTTGVGQHQMWAAQFYTFRRPRQWITSGGLGTMGYGVPASIGAKLAVSAGLFPGDPTDRPVINIDGDGSFCMTAMEMVTAAQYGIKAKTIILNNDFQGMVKQWQDLFYGRRYSNTAMKNPDFARLAEAHGVRGLCCDDKKKLPHAVEQMLSHDGPILVDFRVDPDEHVYPMVPSGKGLHEQVLGVIGKACCSKTDKPLEQMHDDTSGSLA
jgi:acetolactate synthase-1/2/3 large subunit